MSDPAERDDLLPLGNPHHPEVKIRKTVLLRGEDVLHLLQLLWKSKPGIRSPEDVQAHNRVCALLMVSEESDPPID